MTSDAADTDQNHCHDALQTALLDTAVITRAGVNVNAEARRLPCSGWLSWPASLSSVSRPAP